MNKGIIPNYYGVEIDRHQGRQCFRRSLNAALKLFNKSVGSRRCGLEGLTALTLTSTVFCDVTPCSLLEVSPTFRLYRLGRRIGQAVPCPPLPCLTLLILKKATGFTETSITFYQNTRRHIREAVIIKCVCVYIYMCLSCWR
jgi:hypothetical protein